MEDRQFGRHWFKFNKTVESRHAANQLKEHHKKRGRKVRIIERRIRTRGIPFITRRSLYDVYVR